MSETRDDAETAREGAGGRGPGTAIAVAVALLVALLLAAPILYIRLGEARQRLERLLHRARSVRDGEVARVARVRADLDRCVEDRARGQEEVLTHVETGVRRMVPRPLSEVRLPEPIPVPRDLAPAVAELTAPPTPVASVHDAPSEEAGDREVYVVNEVDREVVAVWVLELDHRLRLSEMQKQRCGEILSRYRESLRNRLQAARGGQGLEVVQDMRAIREEAMRHLEGILTAEQTQSYRLLKAKDHEALSSGVIAPPLPGTSLPRARAR